MCRFTLFVDSGKDSEGAFFGPLTSKCCTKSAKTVGVRGLESPMESRTQRTRLTR
jgi:hypothetical protein